MRKNLNEIHIEGRVYQHNLALKESGPTSKNPGTEFIAGNLEIATDEEGLNVISVHFTYMTATYASGKANASFSELKKIINGGKTWVANGKDEAIKVKVDGSLALNDFPAQDGTMVAQKINEGSFVTIVNELCPENERNTFSADMVITNIDRVEANPDRNIENDYVVLKGAIFNFRNELLPMDFAVRNPNGMAYFENLEITGAEPIYTKIWGKIASMTTVTTVTEEAAFGEAAVRTYERKSKSLDVTGTAKVPYDFGDEEVMTVEELTAANQNRQIHLAEVKKRNEEYKAQKAAAPSAITAAKATGFSF